MHEVIPETLNVLVVDDDPIAVRILVDVIGREGHQAISASSAEEILELLPYWTFHVAFIDHRLPGMDGLVLAEYLQETRTSTKVALVTASDDPRLKKKTEAAGVYFISKPFTAANVLEVIESYRSSVTERMLRHEKERSVQYTPEFTEHLSIVADCYGVPNIPTRVEERVVRTIKAALNVLRSEARYNERDRIIALSGLIAARVLAMELPKTNSGTTLYEEYDDIMKLHGRRTEFIAPRKDVENVRKK